ncbi:MAG TPA: hypothetical protein VFH47_00330, partial [Candidatus Thermoplasmatota archaeon]|nr:hypothetical protein [Candidatus Thermoplasmatota archaeon]
MRAALAMLLVLTLAAGAAQAAPTVTASSLQANAELQSESLRLLHLAPMRDGVLPYLEVGGAALLLKQYEDYLWTVGPGIQDVDAVGYYDPTSPKEPVAVHQLDDVALVATDVQPHFVAGLRAAAARIEAEASPLLVASVRDPVMNYAGLSPRSAIPAGSGEHGRFSITSLDVAEHEGLSTPVAARQVVRTLRLQVSDGYLLVEGEGLQQRWVSGMTHLDTRSGAAVLYEVATPSGIVPRQSLDAALLAVDAVGDQLHVTPLPATDAKTATVLEAPRMQAAVMGAVAGVAALASGLVVALQRHEPTLRHVERELEQGKHLKAARTAGRILRRHPG